MHLFEGRGVWNVPDSLGHAPRASLRILSEEKRSHKKKNLKT